MNKWKPIDTCPSGQEVLFWWRPASDNPFAECVVKGSLPYDPKFSDKWWDSSKGRYQERWHVVLWTELPEWPKGVMERRQDSLWKAKTRED